MALIAILIVALTSGCASVTNPVANGVPVRRLPPELLAGPEREEMLTIPLTLLGQDPAEEYILAAGDVLGVFVGGVLPVPAPNASPKDPPVYFPSQIDPLGVGLSPALGFPLPVRDDGTIALPLIDPVKVTGMSVEEATSAVRQEYIDAGILERGRERIFVTLMQPRQIRVLVFRQEVGGFASGGRGDIASSTVKQGTGHAVELRAYENDVLTALAETGGLPGLDTFDEIFVFRRGQENRELSARLQNLRHGESPLDVIDADVPVIRIPTRWPPNEPVPFGPEDVILHPGDVVFVEARATDLFYAGGLLPSGEYELPRDYDLDVLEAVAQVQGTLLNGAFGGNNLTGRLIERGVGSPSPSLLTVVRKTPDGRQIPIRVNLNRALRDRRERILVRPGDLLVLQATPGEALARYASEVFNFDVISNVIDRGSTQGFVSLSVPEPD